MHYGLTLTKRTTISIVTASALIAIVVGPILFNSESDAFSNDNGKSNNNSNVTVASSSSTSSLKPSCDQSLWNFIANPPGRFKIINQCINVTGTVLSINPEPDGDTDFPLLLDAPYRNMITHANFNSLMRGGIWVEMICQHPEQPSAVEAFKRGECNRYSGPIFNLPQIGQHLMVTGTYLLDLREGGHAEIHPVSSIQLIK